MGFTVPDDLSIVGWDDSLISQVVHPPLTAITRDITAYGVAAARHLFAAIEGGATATSRRPAASSRPGAAPHRASRQPSR